MSNSDPTQPETNEPVERLSPAHVTSEWERACDQILEGLEEDKPILHAQLLISHFLVPMSEQQTAIVNQNWIGVAGHLSRSIRVADSNGEILGELPPLIVPIDTQIVDDESQNLGHIAEEAQKQAMFSPRVGDLYMQDQFARRGFRSSSLLRSMLTWNALAIRVGGPIPFAQLHEAFQNSQPEPTQTTTNTSLGISDEDELV